jgi:Domain of unknown function (DUF4062)
MGGHSGGTKATSAAFGCVMCHRDPRIAGGLFDLVTAGEALLNHGHGDLKERGQHYMDIFISSVGRELKLERQAVIREVLKLGDRPIGMEYFAASPEPPLEECLSQLADADLMILVLGPSYGSIHAATGISYTENEFRYARNAGIDVLAFAMERLADRIVAANDATASKKYGEFLHSVTARVKYDEFASPDQLALAVSAAISNYKKRHGELGRRVTPFVTGAEYFSWLLDPNKYFNHSWILVGRQDALSRIQSFATGKGTIGVLYGAGGLGKSKILLEFATKFDEQGTGWEVRFLRETMPLSSNFARGLPAEPCIVIVDDAHRYPELETALTLLHTQQYAGRTKFILTARPSSKQVIEGTLARSADPSETIDLGRLEPLSTPDVRSLAQQALGPDNAIHLERLVRASSKSPIVTVVGGRLIREKQLDPRLFATDEDFQRAVLNRFTEELTKGLPAPPQPWKDLLAVISALGPVRAGDPRIRQTAAEFLKMEPWELVERLGVLEQSGLLLRRGGLVEITPDVLADHLLQSACVSASGEDTGLSMGLFQKFAALAGSDLFRNLGELQWRIDQTKGQPQVLSGIWSTVRTEFASADYATRVEILKVIREAATYQPEEAIEIVKEAIALD